MSFFWSPAQIWAESHLRGQMGVKCQQDATMTRAGFSLTLLRRKMAVPEMVNGQHRFAHSSPKCPFVESPILYAGYLRCIATLESLNVTCLHKHLLLEHTYKCEIISFFRNALTSICNVCFSPTRFKLASCQVSDMINDDFEGSGLRYTVKINK